MAKPLAPRRRRSATQKRALKSAQLNEFVQQYGRRAQKASNPMTAVTAAGLEKIVKRMKPVELDRLLRDDED